MNIQPIPLAKLVPSPANVRKVKTGIESLAANIAALKLLVKQKKIGADYPVPCEVRDGTDTTEISLAENEMREAMHPADQFEVFKKLADEGRGEEEIAARIPAHQSAVRHLSRTVHRPAPKVRKNPYSTPIHIIRRPR